MSKKVIHYCGIPIEYTLTRKPVRNLNIRINEYGEIYVSAGHSVAVADINSFVESKAEWIIRNLAKVERYNQVKPDSEIYEGKRVYYLGEVYTIEIIESQNEKIEKNQRTIVIFTKDGANSLAMKEQYLRWLKTDAETVFDMVLKNMYAIVQCENIPYPKITIRNMKTRWGSCNTATGGVSLNIQLMKTDLGCIEQVVMHELLHFRYANHSKNFYALLDNYMPDWRQRKRCLEERYKDGI